MALTVTVLGDVAGNALLAEAGCEVRANVPPAPGDLVFVGASALCGPVRSIADALKLAAGIETGHLAIWLTEVHLSPDPELVQLVEYEMREYLEYLRVIPFWTSDSLPVFRSDDAELSARIAEFARSEPRTFILGMPEILNEW